MRFTVAKVRFGNGEHMYIFTRMEVNAHVVLRYGLKGWSLGGM